MSSKFDKNGDRKNTIKVVKIKFISEKNSLTKPLKKAIRTIKIVEKIKIKSNIFKVADIKYIIFCKIK